MVATKLAEVTAKGIGWAYGSSPETPAAAPPPDNTTASSKNDYWTYATSSFQSALEATNATLAGLVSSIYSNESVKEALSSKLPPPPTQPDTPLSSKHGIKTYPLVWMLQNPYSRIGGHVDQPSSLSAIRSLLTIVPMDQSKETLDLTRQDTSSSLDVSVSSVERTLAPPAVSRSETASQLAEGTIRALRDLELEEAMELHSSLRYWTARWERPLLSWLEAGPWIWFSDKGYNHKLVGQRVSQIQAVLARRCAAIGELQQHLLRAGWQKGVSQWGVLGSGQWTAVAGFDGAMEKSSQGQSKPRAENHVRQFSTQIDMEDMPVPESLGDYNDDVHRLVYSSSRLAAHDPNSPMYYGNASVCVRKTDGGAILTDDPALAAWSVDAMRVVRDQLFRAGNGLVELPFVENWTDHLGEVITEGADVVPTKLPQWASQEKTAPVEMGSEAELHPLIEQDEEDDVSGPQMESPAAETTKDGKITITDLNLLACEVSELLDTMEVVMEQQRNRRLEKLKGLPLARRNWYMAAIGGPMTTYLVYRLLKDGTGIYLARLVVEKVGSFVREHVYEPLSAIFNELFTRSLRDSMSDHKARIEVIESLKKMIRSWLDETYPLMEEDERRTRAENMDMSLIEQKKEENMKTIFEINSVVRMSLIEMQFIKKEMMNALYAIDEMMESNEINMNLAAVTPAVLLLFGVKHVSRFLFYALLKIEKSREEVYESFRHVILDIERLLVMRDSPPSVPPPLTWTEDGQPTTVASTDLDKPRGPSVLNSDDLGMLMLHIHECRTILWRHRRRFSQQTLRDVGEDLAELAGERGAVSVQQQLQIIARMCRTYSFLKVVSTGVAVPM